MFNLNERRRGATKPQRRSKNICKENEKGKENEYEKNEMKTRKKKKNNN